MLLSKAESLERIEAEDGPVIAHDAGWDAASEWTREAMALTKCEWTTPCDSPFWEMHENSTPLCARCVLLRCWAEVNKPEP